MFPYPNSFKFIPLKYLKLVRFYNLTDSLNPLCLHNSVGFFPGAHLFAFPLLLIVVAGSSSRNGKSAL